MNAIRHVRKNIFKVSQSEFAAIAGVTQASVSRWENGVPLTSTEMQAIRAEAERRVLDGRIEAWDDALFFDAPAQGKAA